MRRERLPDKSEWAYLPTTRNETVAAGARYYFTGRPCRRGHIVPRYLNGGECIICASLKLQRQMAERGAESYKRALRARQRKWSKKSRQNREPHPTGRKSRLPSETEWSLMPATAAEARRIGAQWYFTGQACKRGHVAPRREGNRTCAICAREDSADGERLKPQRASPAR